MTASAGQGGPAVPGGQAADPPADTPPAAAAGTTPQTLAQLFAMIGRQALRRIGRFILLLILLGPLVWAGHTFLVVWANEGVGPNAQGLYSSLLNILNASRLYEPFKALFLSAVLVLRGSVLSGTLFWTLGGLLFVRLLGVFYRRRLGATLRGLAGLPSFAHQCARDAGKVSRSAMVGGAGAGLIFGDLVGNRLISLQLLLIAFGALVVRERSLFATALRLARSDVQRWTRRSPGGGDAVPASFLTALGIAVGVAATVVLPTWVGMVVGVPALVVALALGSSGPSQAATAILLFIGVAAWLTLASGTAFADDGGWLEGGGNFADWVRSEGAFITLIYGLPPALGFPVGVGLGSVLGGLDVAAIPVPGPMPPGAPTAPTAGIPWLPPSWDFPFVHGGPWDLPFTEFDGGKGPGACGPGMPNTWVNTATLTLFAQDTFMQVSGVGPVLDVSLRYGSLAERGPFGSRWRFHYEAMVVATPDRCYVRLGTGRVIRFGVPTGPAGVAGAEQEAPALDGAFDGFHDAGSEWIFVEKTTQLRYRFGKPTSGPVARLRSIEDPSGNTLGVQYDPGGRLSSVTDAAGRLASLSYDGNGNCVAIRAPDGRHARFEYDGHGNLVHTVDFAGLAVGYRYDGDGDLVDVIVGDGSRHYRFAYQWSTTGKRVTTASDPTGATTRYDVVSEQPFIVRRVDAEDRAWQFESQQGLTTRVVDPLGATSTTTFSGRLPAQLVDRNGGSATFEHDHRGNLTLRRTAGGAVTKFWYDLADNLVAVDNSMGERWSIIYDGASRPVTLTGPTGAQHSVSYDGRGQPSGWTTPSGGRWAVRRDPYGNVSATTDPRGSETRTEYDAAGLWPCTLTDPLGNVTRFDHDGNGRLTKLTHPDGSFRAHIYDCCVATTTLDELGRERSFERDAALQVTTIRAGSGAPVRLERDRSGQLQAVVDQLGRRTVNTTDPLGRVAARVDPAGHAVKYLHDGEGNLLEVRSARGGCHRFSYDADHQLVSVIDPRGAAETLGRDVVGRVTSITNRRGHAVRFVHDRAGRLTEKWLGNERLMTASYDDDGRLTSAQSPAATISIAYDPAGLPCQVCHDAGQPISLAYDAAGNVTRLSYPSGLVVDYAYDVRGRIRRVSWRNRWIELEYDKGGNALAIIRSNGSTSRYRYDDDDRIVDIEHQGAAERIAHVALRRDGAGNVTEQTIDGARLPPHPQPPPGTATYADDDRLASWQGAACEHDADGNLTVVPGRWSAVFDPASRLTCLERDGSRRDYGYDPLGDRCKVVSATGARVVRHDPFGRALCETTDASEVLAENVYCGTMLIARELPRGEVLFYHFDSIGSTLAVTDGAGAVRTAYAYTPFGLVAEEPACLLDNPFTFVGAYGVTDEGQGVYRMGARYYDALLGRFLSPDPLGLADDVNLYRYGRDNPLTWIDPEGEAVFTILFILGAIGTAVTVGTIGYKVKSALEDKAAADASEKARWEAMGRINQVGGDDDRAVNNAQRARKRLQSDTNRLGQSFGEAGASTMKEGAKAVFGYGTGKVLGQAGEGLIYIGGEYFDQGGAPQSSPATGELTRDASGQY
ncbi:MAG: hypothetical protein DRI90_03925, partial [Deltaproteobacteria bacterium]